MDREDRGGEEGGGRPGLAGSPRPFRAPRLWAGDIFGAGRARAAIFDMDGVLADTEPFHLDSWRILLEGRFGRIVAPEVIRATFGMSNEMIFPLLLPPGAVPDPSDLPRLGAEKEALYRERARGRVRPLAGVERFLEWLRRRGIPAAVGTSGSPENVRFILREFGWERLFRVLVDRTMFAASKPDPDCFLRAAARLGVPPGRTIVFEDSIHGILAARRAGAAAAAVATTHPEERLRPFARWTIGDFREIACD